MADRFLEKVRDTAAGNGSFIKGPNSFVPSLPPCSLLTKFASAAIWLFARSAARRSLYGSIEPVIKKTTGGAGRGRERENGRQASKGAPTR